MLRDEWVYDPIHNTHLCIIWDGTTIVGQDQFEKELNSDERKKEATRLKKSVSDRLWKQ